MDGIKLNWWQLVLIFMAFVGFFIRADAQQEDLINTKLDTEIFQKHEEKNDEKFKMFVEKFDDIQRQIVASEKEIIRILGK